MSFTHSTFCGLTVREVKAALGWNDQQGQLSVGLVDDPINGDSLSVPPIGTPVYFQLGGFKFSGLLQRFSPQNSRDGSPVYEAFVVDPREVLRNTELIIGAYYGNVNGVYNLINCFGYCETALGFGGSEVNESGMPWYLILQALLATVNTPSLGNFGGPLTYQGVSYSIDLTDLPVPPVYYRLGGNNINLLDAISQLCEDFGCDYFVDLTGYTIKIRTVSRANPYALGTIQTLVQENWGSISRWSDGTEAVQGVPTSAFLIGGEMQSVHQTSSIVSFWGYDINGRPIVGVPTSYFLGAPGKQVAVDTEEMDLNATGISDIVGGVSYRCSTLEMRFALINRESWDTYIEKFRPDIYRIINQFNANAVPLPARALNPQLINDDPLKMKAQAQQAMLGELEARRERLYNFVHGYAQSYYGKKFLVSIPFVLTKTDADTLEVSYSQEPIDAAYVDEGDAPLGLSVNNEDLFSDAQGRFGPFIVYNDITGADIATLNPTDAVNEGLKMFVHANIDQKIVFTPAPAVVLTLGSVLFEKAVDVHGDISILQALLQLNDADKFKKALPGIAVGLRVHPAARYPDASAVPLKSNILTYGPWYAQGSPGKVRFEQDTSLVPWNYGGYTYLDLAAKARVTNAVSNQQVIEEGYIEIAGTPNWSLGDVMQTGGPNITNVAVNYSVQGVTTTFSYRVFSPRFGNISRVVIERMKRSVLGGVEVRRKLRQLFRENTLKAFVVDQARKGFAANLALPFKKQTPHDVFWANIFTDENGRTVTNPMVMPCHEIDPMLRADDDSEWQQTSVMSLGGLVRPFSTNPNASGIAAFGVPSGNLTSCITSQTYNPFKQGNDIPLLAWGQTYAGCKSLDRGTSDENDTRAFAQRMPMLGNGWGYDIQGNPVPGDGSGGFTPNYLTRQDLWKAGPMDFRWNPISACWTSNDVMVGVLATDLLPSGSAQMNVYVGSGVNSNYSLTVHNWFSAGVSGSKRVIANYSAMNNRWYVVAADC